MARRTLDLLSIVLVGELNPAIFQPAWLASNGLVPAQEAEHAEIGVIHPDIAVFDIAKIHYEVTRDRFLIQTSDISQLMGLPDVVLGIFSLLEHTPLRQLGMNRTVRFQVDSPDELMSIWSRLAPLSSWAKVLPAAIPKGIKVANRLDADHLAVLNVALERIVGEPLSLNVSFNEHHEADGEKLFQIVGESWLNSTDRANQLADTLINAVDAEQG